MQHACRMYCHTLHRHITRTRRSEVARKAQHKHVLVLMIVFVYLRVEKGVLGAAGRG